MKCLKNVLCVDFLSLPAHNQTAQRGIFNHVAPLWSGVVCRPLLVLRGENVQRNFNYLG